MKVQRLLLTAVLVMIFAVPAFAAILSHSPDHAYVAVAAGSSVTVPMTVSIADVKGTYNLWFVDSVDGTLPKEWVRPAKVSTFLSQLWNSASTNLTISVPGDAAPGMYSGRVMSKAMQAHGYADPGRGMLVEVLVTSECSTAPEVDISGFGPEVIWPPNHDEKSVTVSGVINIPSGCTLGSVGYSIEDEYGELTGEGEITVRGDGSFGALLHVEAWRDGQDMDGRHYTITIYAEDEAGIGTSDVLEVVVPHDKGKRPNAE